MKIKDISLKNFAAYENVSVSFDPNVTYLIGNNGAGKSTIGINAVHFILQGIAEKSSGGNTPLIGERFRFIGDKGRSATGEMTIRDEVKGFDIKVVRKLTKTGSELSFEAPEGMQLDQQWLNSLFNIFMIAPKRFTELSGKEQAIELGIDTSKEDNDIAILKAELTGLNRDLKQYENLQVVEKVDEIKTDELIAEKEKVRLNLNEQYVQNKERNAMLRAQHVSMRKMVDADCKDFNDKQTALANKINLCSQLLAGLSAEGYTGEEVSGWIMNLGVVKDFKDPEKFYPKEPTDLSLVPEDYELQLDEQFYIKEVPDDAELVELDKKINEASVNNMNYLLYTQYLKKVSEKEGVEKKIKTNKASQKKAEEEKIKKVKEHKFPFDNITVNEDGELLLNDKLIRTPYFSTGQLLKYIPKLIATTNPELKYIFLQDFNLMDEETQKDIEEYLTGQGFQLVIEYVGKQKLIDKNCILLKNGGIVESYDDEEKKQNIL